MFACLEMLVSLLGLCKAEHAVDHRPKAMGGDCPIHGFETCATADIDPADDHGIDKERASIEMAAAPM
jgi:hypothetical protein